MLIGDGWALSGPSGVSVSEGRTKSAERVMVKIRGLGISGLGTESGAETFVGGRGS